MDILIDTLTSLVQTLVDGLIQECRFCCCFNPIVEDFEKKRGNLIANEKTVQKDVDAAKNACEEIEEEVKKWQLDAKSLIEEDTKTKQKCFFNLCPDCIWRYKRGKDLAQKKVEIAELIEKSKFSKVGRPTKGPGIKFHSSQDYIDFESRKSEKKQVMDALANGSYHLIGLQGMGGCGKSELVKQVGNEVQSSEPKLFDRVIYVVVSSCPDVIKIQHDIARHLGLPLEEGKESEHPEKLWSRLSNGEKILIILDDVWEDLKLKDIGIPVNEEHNGCCVLITTRNKGIFNSMVCQRVIELKSLSKEDAWTLFKKRAAPSGGDFSNDFKNVGQKIVEECGKLPVVIAAIASTLKGRSIEHWKSAFTSLKKAKPIENTEKGLISAYRSLELSYTYLESEEARRLFLLCSVFPEDYKIPLEDLTRFAIGLGLFEEVDLSYEILRGKVISARDELLDSSLLLQPSERCYSLHDLIRDVAQWIANQDIQSIMGPRTNMERCNTMKYLYCDKMDVFPSWLAASTKLEFLTVTIRYHSMEIPEAFFEQMKSLKVLTLKLESSKSSMLFPQSITLLHNLRTLHLEGCKSGDITFLEKLEKLEMLELRYCEFNELPDGIVKLEKLKLLGLIACKLKRNPWKVISRLSKIEELYFMNNITDSVDTFFDENSLVQPLKSYQIEIGEPRSLCNIYDPENDFASRVICLDYFDGFTSHAIIMDLVRRAEILQLNKLRGGYRSITPDVVEAVGEMNELIWLGLDSCSEIEYLIDSSTAVSSQGATIFNKLVKLHLCNMDQLMELCHDTPPSDTFSELKELFVYECKNLDGRLFARNLNLTRLEVLSVASCSILKSLFTLSTASHLVQLKMLQILSCDQLEQIITNEQEEEKGEEIVHDDHQQQIYGSFFPKLCTLLIDDCHQLEFIFPFSSVPVLSSLEYILLNRASQLKYIFGPYPNKDHLLHQKDKEIMLPACRELFLSNLPNFISIFPESLDPSLSSSHLEDKDGPESRQLEITTQLGSQTQNSEWLGPLKQRLIFRNIRKMTIITCPKLTSLFTLPIETMFLEELTIRKCDALRHIIQNGGDYHDQIEHGSIFPKLKAIHLENLPNITRICEANCYAPWPSLNSFYVSECPLLTITCINKPVVDSNAKQTAKKEALKETLKPLGTMENLSAKNTKIEGIFNVEELAKDGQQVKCKLSELNLLNLPELKYIFMGPRHTFSLWNVNSLTIKGCGKLKAIFSVSVLKSIPHLRSLHVEDCQDLEYIIEENEGIQNVPKAHNQPVCFPKLATVVVKRCGNLEYLFSISIDNTFPELELLFVEDNSKLKKIFSGERGRTNMRMQDVLPKLKYLLLKELQSLPNNVSLDIQFCPVEYCIVKACPELAFSSTTTFQKLKYHFDTLDEDIRIGELDGWDIAELIVDEDYEDVEPKDEEMVQSDEDSENNISTPEDVGTQVEESLESEMYFSEPQGVNTSVEEDPTSKKDTLKTSTNSEPGTSRSVPSSTSSHETSPYIIKEKGQISPKSEKAMHNENSEDASCKDQEEFIKTTCDIGDRAKHVAETQKIVLESPISDLERKKSSSESTEEALPPAAIKVNKEGLPSRNYGIITSINNSDELVDEQSLSEPMKRQQQGHGETKIATEIPPRNTDIPSNEDESSISEKAAAVTPLTDFTEPLVIPIQKIVGENVEGTTLEKSETVASLTLPDLGSKQRIIEEIVPKLAASAKPVMKISSSEQSPSTVLSIIENVEVGPTLEKAEIASSSIHSETKSSEQDTSVTCLHETSPKEFIVKESANLPDAVEQELEENKITHRITQKDEKPSDLKIVKGPSNEKKTSLRISSTIPELKGSTLTSVLTFPKKISPLISSIPKMNASASHSWSSGMVLQPELLQELKTELDTYLNMSLEAIYESNAFDNVERVVNSLARGTADVIQRNILEDLATRLTNIKECIPEAMNTKQSSFEFMSNYENLNMELNDKLSKGQGKIGDLESKFSDICEEEYAIEMEIQQLITRKFEILAQKNSLALQLDQSAQEVSRDYEEWKALGEELKLSTDQWLKSKEVLAHGNASWRVFKESLIF